MIFAQSAGLVFNLNICPRIINHGTIFWQQMKPNASGPVPFAFQQSPPTRDWAIIENNDFPLQLGPNTRKKCNSLKICQGGEVGVAGASAK